MATILALAAGLAAHHSGALADMQHHIDVNAALEMCLAVSTAVGAALAAATVPVIAFAGRRRAPASHGTDALTAPEAPVARARHGPAAVAVLCVSRR